MSEIRHYSSDPRCGVSVCGQVAIGAGRGDPKTLQSDAATTTCELCKRWWNFPLPIPRSPW